MKRLSLIFAIFGLALLGCGGSGSTLNVYAGQYQGPYTYNGDSGTVNLTVGEFGALSGTTVSNGAGGTYNISGSLTDANAIIVTLTLQTNSATTIALSGSFTPINNNNTVTYTASMTTAAGVTDTWSPLTQTASLLSKHKS